MCASASPARRNARGSAAGATKTVRAAPRASRVEVAAHCRRDAHPQGRRRRVRSRARTAAGSARAADARSRFRKHALVLAFEGMDAAGKGGAIRRITHALDARQYQVVPVSAPTAEERSYPTCGASGATCRSADTSRSSIVPGTAACWSSACAASPRRPDWRRAYAEICEFERQLTEHGLIVAKFWLQVSKDEQLRRFKERDEDPLKRFKVDPEDWTNRAFYDAYQAAAAEMIQRTDSPHARWTRRAGRRQEERAPARAARGLRGHRGSAGPLRIRKQIWECSPCVGC